MHLKALIENGIILDPVTKAWLAIHFSRFCREGMLHGLKKP